MGQQQKLKQQRAALRVEDERQSEKRKKATWMAVGAIVILALIGGGVWWGLKHKTTQQTKGTETVEHAIIKTDKGEIALDLYPDRAPKTVENFLKLARDHFYDGTTFHRVVSGFVIQGGDPNSKDDDPSNDGQGGPGYAFDDEINAKSLGLSTQQISALEAQGYKYRTDVESLKMEVGVLAMANSGPGTNGSQFFIVTDAVQPHLDGKHTVFGRVVSGMDVVKKITQGDVMRSIEVTEAAPNS